MNPAKTPVISSNTETNSHQLSSEDPRFFEIAVSRQPRPVARLMEQMSIARLDLDEERESHKLELQRQCEDYSANLARVRSDHGRSEGKWASLEVRTRALRLEIEQLRGAGSVARGTSVTSSQKVNNYGQWENVSPDEAEEWREAFALCPTRDLEQIFASLSRGHKQRSQGWLDEKAKLAESHSKMEERISVLTNEVEASDQNSKQLQKRLEIYEAKEIRLKSEIEHLQLRNTTYTKLLKDLNDGNKIIEACVQNQSKQYLEAHDNIHTALALPCVSAVATASANDISDGSRPMVGKEMVAFSGEPFVPDSVEAREQDTPGLQSSARHIEIKTNLESPGSNVATVPKTSRGHKRTLSELLDDERDTSSRNDQRRRTGFGSYVAMSNQAWKEGAKSTTAVGRPPQRDLAANWRACETDLATTKPPIDWAQSLIRPVVSLPSSPEKMFSQKLNVDSRSPGNKDVVSNESLVGSDPFVPTHMQDGFQKWKNSMLKKRL